MHKGKIYFVTGESRAGKTTVAQMIAEEDGLKPGNCSDSIFTEITRRFKTMPPEELAKFTPLPISELDEVAIRTRVDKEMIRQFMSKVGNELCEKNKTALIDANVNRGVRVVSGVRRGQELNDAREHYRALGYDVVVLYIDHPNRKKTIKDNNEITADMADIVIVNSSDFESLRCKVKSMHHVTPAARDGMKTVVLTRGLDDRERIARARAAGGAYINAADRNSLPDFISALGSGSNLIAVSGQFAELNQMKPFVATAVRQGCRIDISNPPAPGNVVREFQAGGVKEILVSRSHAERLAALKKTLSRQEDPAENYFDRMEREEYLAAAYHPEMVRLGKDGFFGKKGGAISLFPLNTLSQEASRIIAHQASESSRPPFAVSSAS